MVVYSVHHFAKISCKNWAYPSALSMPRGGQPPIAATLSTLFYSFIETAKKDKTRGKKFRKRYLTLMILAEIFYNTIKG